MEDLAGLDVPDGQRAARLDPDGQPAAVGGEDRRTGPSSLFGRPEDQRARVGMAGRAEHATTGGQVPDRERLRSSQATIRVPSRERWL